MRNVGQETEYAMQRELGSMEFSLGRGYGGGKEKYREREERGEEREEGERNRELSLQKREREGRTAERSLPEGEEIDWEWAQLIS